jgi:uncharacterized membrane protein YjgN (DUF898 family)
VTDATQSDAGQSAEPDKGFYYSGWTGDILLLTLKNAVLNILTLSIYRFWGKTNVRRHLWQHTKFLGDPLEYTGVGKELFLGFVLILFVVLFPLAIANELVLRYLGPFGAAQVVSVGLVLFLIGVAQYRARRYRLSRTVWRGIRAAQVGSPWRYGLMRLGFLILLPLTLGWSYPWQRMYLTHFETTNTVFGDRGFRFDGSVAPLYKPFAVAWSVSLVMLAIGYAAASSVFDAVIAPTVMTLETSNDVISAAMRVLLTGYFAALLFLPAAPFVITWYRVREFTYFANRTGYEGIEFQFDGEYWNLFRLAVGNYLIILGTLTLGAPIAQMRIFRYFCDHVSITGSADFDAIRQSTEERDKLGEGLADAFDVGDF